MEEEIIVCEDHILYCHICKKFTEGVLFLKQHEKGDIWFWVCKECRQKIVI